MKITRPKRKMFETSPMVSQIHQNSQQNQENIPSDLDVHSNTPRMPNSVSPNSLSDISNVTENESPRIKRMRFIKEKKNISTQTVSAFVSPRVKRMRVIKGIQQNNMIGETSATPTQNSSHNYVETLLNSNQASSSHFKTSMFDPIDYYDNGDANNICGHCDAELWLDERIKKWRVKGVPKFSLCCMHGKIDLPPLQKTPKKILDLMFKGDSKSKHYMENIRSYNSSYAFTYMCRIVDDSVNKGRGPSVFRLHGENKHLIGSLLPPPGETARFNQLYIQDTENESEERIKAFCSNRDKPTPPSKMLQTDVMDDIKAALDEVDNPYVDIFRTAKDRFKLSPEADVKIKLISRRTSGGDTYNLPTTSEVAALYSGDFDFDMKPRDIVLETKNGNMTRISELHAGYLSLHYPLLFPWGEDGYHIDLLLKKTKTTSTKPRTKVSMREFFAFRLMERAKEEKTLMSFGKLFQQFMVDGLTMIEAERIGYLKLNQKTLRADKYANVVAAADVENENSDASKSGTPFVLPSTFDGSAHCMQQRYMDAMAVCQHFGFPDLFITITCNPKWPEITRHLRKRGHQSVDRADIVVRVFKMKLDMLVADIKKYKVFGPAAAVIYQIEFQKRGLPHAHIILFLKKGSKLNDPTVVDNFICAEIPDEAENPTLYNLMKECMMHGPCGRANPNAPCMENGRCTKNFPKNFTDHTHINKDGFPEYKRPDDGRTVEKNGVTLDNRYVIPYCPFLLLKYGAHINLEWCSESKAIKYLFKYMNKGNDRITATITRAPACNKASSSDNVVDEIKHFYDFRYISPCEAAWRIFGFATHYSSVPIHRLNYHLEGEHSITYADDEDMNVIIAKEGNQTSQLLQYFETCKRDEDARKLLYIEFPSHYVWKTAISDWNTRQRQKSYGRMHNASSASSERFYLKILLNNIRGATCFEDLRTVNEKLYTMFKETCHALGYLDDDKQYIVALNEASVSGSGHSLRRIFVTLLSSESLSTPLEAKRDPPITRFGYSLLSDGKLSEPNDGEVVIDIPEDLILRDSLDPKESIALNTYPSLLENLKKKDYFKERAILCPTNDVVDEVNDYMMELLPGHETEYLSSDKLCAADTSKKRDKGITVEYLNSIKSSGLPNHVLRLKEGAPIMLLRNIDQKHGLCNGTRLQITKLKTEIIEAEVLTGSCIGEQAFIPKIAIIPTDTKFPFRFQRRQFPVAPCFGMTINTSQSQNLSHVSIYLPRPVFSHGQFYVAVSRVTSRKGLKILILDENGERVNKTTNVVYKEIF